MLSPVELVFIAIVVCGTMFWITMLVDCIKHEPRIQDRLFWSVIIALTHFVGALIYFFVRRPKRSRLVAKGRKMSFGVALLALLLPGAGLASQGAQTTPAAPPAAPAAPPAAALSEADLYARAEALVAAITAGKNEEVGKALNDEMRQALPSPSALPEAWRGVEQKMGSYQGITGRRLIEAPPYRVVIFDVAFGKMPLELRIPYQADGKIAGFRFFPKPAAPVPVPAPGYADASKFEEQEVTVGSGDWALPGTLTIPKGPGPFPAVVLVHGSGPADRDETVGGTKPFRDLAWGLATRGIAVLRYDKRTFAHARKMTPDLVARLTVKEETVDDAVAGAELLRRTPKVDPARVHVLGHSLGAMLAPRIGVADPKIAGLILLAAPSRRLEDLLPGQFTYLFSLDGKISEPEQAQLDLLRKQVEKVKSPDLSASTPTNELPLNLPAAYWLDLRPYDQVETARQLGKPMLILQGGRDYQVTTEDLDHWKAAFEKDPKVRIQLLPKLDHLFREGEGKSSPEAYSQPGNVAQEVVEAVAGWVVSGTKSR